MNLEFVSHGACSWDQCRVHANIRKGSFMPLHLWKAYRSWSASGGVWFFWFCSDPIKGEALLDLEELMGTELGRGGLLQDLQRS